MRGKLISTIAVAFWLGLVAPRDATAQAVPARNTCVSCHTEAGDELAVPVKMMADDIHARRGLSCANCHGGDPNDDDVDRSMDPRKGFVGKPGSKQVSSFCGKCHSNPITMKRFNPGLRVDQEAEFATSIHGKRVASGDTKAATCISCHSAHGVRAVKDPNAPVYPTRVADTCARCHSNSDTMKAYGIPADQVQKYQNSIHAETLLKKNDLSAPTCNDCHGNHGAAPPSTTSVANICGTCHIRQAELFSKSTHKSTFEAMSLSDCVVCHGNHEIKRPTDEMVGTGSQAVCLTCHSPGETGFQAAEAMHQGLTALNARIAEADEVLGRAAHAGMEVSKARFELQDARDSLVNARVVVHSFAPGEVEKAVSPGMEVSDKAYQAGLNALDELLFRRKGLAVSLVVIAVAAFSIYLKMQQLERGT